MLGMISLCSRPRHAVYQTARERNPRRWSRQIRDWTPVTAVALNPERDTRVQVATSQRQLSGSIGKLAFPPRPGNALAAARSGGAWAAKSGPREHSHPEPRAAPRAWRGWRAPDLPRSEHRGILGLSRTLTERRNGKENKISRYELRAATWLTLTGRGYADFGAEQAVGAAQLRVAAQESRTAALEARVDELTRPPKTPTSH